MCEPEFELANINFRKGWLRVLMILGALMLVSGLFFMRLDLVVEGEGVVEARKTARLYASREARVKAIRAEAGEEVSEGAVLVELSDEALGRELMEVRLQKAAGGKELRLALLEERELELTGGGLELDLAGDALALQREQLATLEEVQAIYRTLAETGSVSRLELLDLDARFLASRREQLMNQRRMDLREAGVMSVWLEGLRARQEAARATVAALTEREQTLVAELAALTVRAPHAGRVTRVFVRDVGERVERGMLLAGVADVSAGYEARVFVGDRNVDLIRVGSPVRLETPVFSSMAEGYIRGTVSGMVMDADASPGSGFEVVVALEEWPVEPVIGSRVSAEIILQRQGVAGLLVRKPDRDYSVLLTGKEVGHDGPE
ncbi:MAG: HlyD family efflux transporter periplasmic adaptor subunit [Verrucomicrobia bacterium]|nr:HlyD family efflux transporter periplasmic adaptor subunit [Verrucomicrobiota bacterium]